MFGDTRNPTWSGGAHHVTGLFGREIHVVNLVRVALGFFDQDLLVDVAQHRPAGALDDLLHGVLRPASWVCDIRDTTDDGLWAACGKIGETLVSTRLHVLGRISLERGGVVADETDLPGRQGRVALAFLVLRRTRPVPRSALVDAIWADHTPSATDSALNALASKIRQWLSSAGLDGRRTLVGTGGGYELRLPAGTWVDVEVAARRVDRATGALRADRHGRAWAEGTVATAILRRPFLVGTDIGWVNDYRQHLHQQLVRALECVSEASLSQGQSGLAAAVAEEMVSAAPFRESGYRMLMRAHASAGDRAEALVVYERCRDVLREELGVSPSAPTTQLFERLLEDTGG